MNRRFVLETLAWAPFILVSVPVRASRAEAQAQVVWRVPAQSLPTAEKYLGQPKSVVPDQSGAPGTRGLPLILIVTAVAFLPQLAEAIVNVYRDYRYGGVMVTKVNGRLEVTTDVRIPANTVVVQSNDDVKIYERTNPDAGDLTGALGSLLGHMGK